MISTFGIIVNDIYFWDNSKSVSLDSISVLIELDERWSNKCSIVSSSCCNVCGRSPDLDLGVLGLSWDLVLGDRP